MPQEQDGSFDAKQMALRNLDLIMYVLYSGDEVFIKDMVTKVSLEVSEEQECNELKELVGTHDMPLLYKCLFFLMLNFQPKFRYWVISENNGTGLLPVCPHKALLFLKTLRDSLVPQFLVNETIRLNEFERDLKVAYIRS